MKCQPGSRYNGKCDSLSHQRFGVIRKDCYANKSSQEMTKLWCRSVYTLLRRGKVGRVQIPEEDGEDDTDPGRKGWIDVFQMSK